jgi:hypothetical protein
MQSRFRDIALAALLLLVPMTAHAEFRRIEIKILGMD